MYSDSSDSDSDLTELSSDLSSIRSLSPPPFFSYPSPQSSQENNADVSHTQQESRKRSRDADDLPPAKKRRSVEAAPRTTTYLDLRSPVLQPLVDQAAQLELLLKTLRKRRKIVVVAGAGISTSAGGELAFFTLQSPSTNLIQSLIFAHPMVYSTL